MPRSRRCISNGVGVRTLLSLLIILKMTIHETFWKRHNPYTTTIVRTFPNSEKESKLLQRRGALPRPRDELMMSILSLTRKLGESQQCVDQKPPPAALLEAALLS